MTPLSWSMAAVLMVVVSVSGVLAAMHIINSDWIEHTLTGIIGFVLGHSLGILRVKRSSPTVTVVHPPSGGSS